MATRVLMNDRRCLCLSHAPKLSQVQQLAARNILRLKVFVIKCTVCACTFSYMHTDVQDVFRTEGIDGLYKDSG